MRIVLAVTGASGICYATAIAKALRTTGHELFVIVTENAEKVMKCEARGALAELRKYGREKVFGEREIDAPIASGSFKADAMIVCPCSMKTLSAIANGFTYNLVTRAADVMLKERRRLVLVPREMPWNAIHFENALKLARLGVVVAPASPGFYHKPKNIQDIVNYVVGKTLDAAGVENNLFKRWK